MSDEVRSGQVRPGQARPGQVRPGEIRSNQVRSGQFSRLSQLGPRDMSICIMSSSQDHARAMFGPRWVHVCLSFLLVGILKILETQST